MRSFRVFQVDAFTDQPLSGNPAGVVLDADAMSDAEMQAVARELNNSETAFVLSPDARDHDVRVRFFTPTTEVPSCGHATIAAHFARARELGIIRGRVLQKIGIGILPVDIATTPQGLEVTMTQGAPEIGPDIGLDRGPDVEARFLAALGASMSDRDPSLPLRIASTGHSKVMVGFRHEATIHALAPDMAALKRLSSEIGCNGFYAFTFDPGATGIAVHGRMFAPAIGIDEDPVTGNANGPLGAYLVDLGLGPGKGEFRFRARQGEAMGRPGEIEVRVDVENAKPVRVRVSGRAVTVFEAELTLP